MIQRVFVRVVGFTGPERHALNTAFRLSQEPKSDREWSHEPWQPNSPAPPKLALIDATSPDASEALAEVERIGGIGIVWVGSISPAKAWASLQRPLNWPAVIAAMDEYFSSGNGLDVDLGGDTWPSVLESTGAHMFGVHDARRVLLAEPDAQDRMYLRTKLASYGITEIDEASNVTEAQQRLAPGHAGSIAYDIFIVDLALPGGDPWGVVAAAKNVKLKLVIGARLGMAGRVRARANGCMAMGKPLDPSRLNKLLSHLPSL